MALWFKECRGLKTLKLDPASQVAAGCVCQGPLQALELPVSSAGLTKADCGSPRRADWLEATRPFRPAALSPPPGRDLLLPGRSSAFAPCAQLNRGWTEGAERGAGLRGQREHRPGATVWSGLGQLAPPQQVLRDGRRPADSRRRVRWDFWRGLAGGESGRCRFPGEEHPRQRGQWWKAPGSTCRYWL